jgi:acetoin utilization protein AcuC
MHEHPATLFPGTGLPSETGRGEGLGTAVNVALPAGTGDAGWLRALDAIVPPLIRAFRPEVLVSQHGCDTHRLDPLAHLELSLDAQRHAQTVLHKLAHEVTGGRWLVTGGGGYELVRVVPRCWTHLLAEASGKAIEPVSPTPVSWREYVLDRTDSRPPESMTDGGLSEYISFESGSDPADPVDRSIAATRAAVFPAHGLNR